MSRFSRHSKDNNNKLPNIIAEVTWPTDLYVAFVLFRIRFAMYIFYLRIFFCSMPNYIFGPDTKEIVRCFVCFSNASLSICRLADKVNFLSESNSIDRVYVEN